MTKTATWIWPDRYSSFKTLKVEASDINDINSLLVGWDITELGAPAFMNRNGVWLYEVFEEDPKTEWLLNLFISQAKLDKSSDTYTNPLVDDNLAEDVRSEALYSFPDKKIKQQLSTETQITINISKSLKELWDSIWIDARGFDPKRGFRLLNLQEIIDPKKKLTKTELTQQRKHYKGLLFQYLQLFIQQGTLELGHYHSYDGIHWVKGIDFGIAEQRTRNEWYLDIYADYSREISDYVELVSALPKLSKHLSAKKAITYQTVVDIFNIDTLFKYDCDNISRSNITLEEILLSSLESFPEEKIITKQQDNYPFILLLVRIYNIQGRFNKAKNLLKDNNLYLYTEKQLEFFNTLPNKYLQLAFYESCICEMVSTGNFDLWRFPDYPKFTDEEIRKFNLHTGAYLLDNPEDIIKHELEQKKIACLMEERAKLEYDLREYLHYSYFNDLNAIYEHLEENNLREGLEEIVVSIIGQINLLSQIDINN